MAETAQLIAMCKHWPAPTALAHCTVILPAGADEETKAKIAQRGQRGHGNTCTCMQTPSVLGLWSPGR